MEKRDFWEYIHRFHEESKGNQETYLVVANEALSKLSSEEKTAFRRFLSAYVGSASNAAGLDMACKVINGYVSDDTGLYFVLWVISLGENVFLNALRNPDTLADLDQIPFGYAEFEMLMAVGFCEEDMDNMEMDDVDFDGFMPAISPETEIIEKDIVYWKGDRYGNYENFEDVMADIPNSVPRLVIRAKKENFSGLNMF